MSNQEEAWAEAFAAMEKNPRKEWTHITRDMRKWLDLVESGQWYTEAELTKLWDLPRGTPEREQAIHDYQEFLDKLRKVGAA
jgi:hypothetical protein